MATTKYKRILIKLSGEALGGEEILFGGAECEADAAIRAGEGLVCETHG